MKNYKITQNIFLLLAPILGISILLLRYRMLFTGVSIYNTPWNDELSYYKQIEGIIASGMPKGYFGYNESTAIIGTFGPWSPIMLFPYAIIFRIIGLGTPQIILVNLIFAELTLFACMRMLQPTGLTAVFWSVLWICNANINRYIFSISPELLVTLWMIWLFIILLKYKESKKVCYFYIAELFLVILTLFRGYYAIFGVLCIILTTGKSKKIFAAVSAIFSAFFYLIIVHFCCSPYFSSLINEKLINKILQPKDFFAYCLYLIKDGITTSLDYILEIPLHTDSSYAGCYYLLSFFIIVISLMIGIKRKNDMSIVAAICFAFVVISIWLLYDIRIGARHLSGSYFSISIIIIYIIGQEENMKNKFVTMFLISVISILTYFGETNYDIKPPVSDAKLIQDIKNSNVDIKWEKQEWSNTVIWTLGCNYRYLFGLPKGIGLNICKDDFLEQNASKIKSGYIAIDDSDDQMKELSKCMEWNRIGTIGEVGIYSVR